MKEADLVDMIQGVMADPDAFATSLGMARVKRSAWDREFNLEKMGFNFKLKYIDPNNKIKVGIFLLSVLCDLVHLISLIH